jgi:anti-anti-sigma regulatory factor
VAPVPDVSPLELQRSGNHLRFVLAARSDALAELPADYEQLLTARLKEILAQPGPLTIAVDLAGRPGISSRQLGSLIALQKVLRGRFGRVPLTGLSEGVRHLLARTHVDQLFDVAPG